MKKIVYCKFSKTLRQQPQNYLIAFLQCGRWVMDPDLAADLDVVIKTTVALMKFENKYEKEENGESLADRINVTLG